MSRLRPWLTRGLFALTLLFGGSMCDAASAQQSTGAVMGTVTAEDTGNPLSGANVYLVGTGLGTLSGQTGGFVIERVPPGTYRLEFSYIGYATHRTEITVAAGQQVSASAQLALDPLMLDEIVVTGYGSARKEELTGSMVSIPSPKLTQLPSTSFQDVIQGSPGVVVTSRDGAPGAGINIRVRGIGSITAGSEPLYVIDGIPLFNDANAMGRTGFDNGNRTANTLASINPNDIESIVVLKDAASTAIYGSRGANGVVLITTKGGVAGSPLFASSPKLEFKYQAGVSDLAFDNIHQPLTADEYHDFYLEARVNSGMSAANAEQQFQNQWPVREDNNWLDLITQKGVTHQYDLSATGGAEKLTYYLSASVYNQEGVVKTSLFDRYSTRVNLTSQLTDKFEIANNLSLSQTKQTAINDGTTFEAPFYMVIFMPAVLPMYDEEGRWYDKHRNVMGANHPLGTIYENPKERQTTRIIDNLTGTYRFDDRFTFASAWSFDIYNVDDYTYDNMFFGDGRNSAGLFDESRADILTWQGTQTLTFADAFNTVHNVDAVVGYEASKSERDMVNTWGEGFAHPALKRGASAAITQGYSDRTAYAFQSAFTRVNYDYDRTYFLSASFRTDGSSRFGPDMRYGKFWSLGAGYTVTNSSFMEDFELFDYLKLRTSYGQVGNADIGNYEWQGLYGFNREYNGLPGAGPSQVANTLLTWESQDAFNIGADYAMWGNRLTGTIEWYKKISSDLLLNVPVSYATGFRSTLQNFGDMENSGLEFSVRANLVRGTDFDLSVDANITTHKNKITKLGEPYIDGTQRREEGRDYQDYYLYPWAGVDPANGKPLYYTDESKTQTTSSINQTTRIYDGKSATPDYTGSFGFQANYKRLTVNAMATYMFGHYIYEYAERYYNGDGGFLPRSTSKWAWDNRWQKPGDVAKVPQQIWGGNSGSNANYNSRFLYQGDYVRLRDVTLAYQFSEALAQRVGANSLNLNLKLNNFFTWVADSDLHMDPEQAFDGRYETGTPNYKTVSLGFTVGF